MAFQLEARPSDSLEEYGAPIDAQSGSHSPIVLKSKFSRKRKPRTKSIDSIVYPAEGSREPTTTSVFQDGENVTQSNHIEDFLMDTSPQQDDQGTSISSSPNIKDSPIISPQPAGVDTIPTTLIHDNGMAVSASESSYSEDSSEDEDGEVSSPSLSERYLDPLTIPLSPEDLVAAKEIVLDLLGWGVPPEYLVSSGVSPEAIYRIFTDLNLSLPTNLVLSEEIKNRAYSWGPLPEPCMVEEEIAL